MSIRCLLYSIYDWAKGTWVISQLFFHGERYRHYGDLVMIGAVIAVDGAAADGDWNFDIRDDIEEYPYHCECTPCYPIPQDTLKALKVGARVRVAGTHTYDPTHLGTPGHWEIHPVKQLEIL